MHSLLVNSDEADCIGHKTVPQRVQHVRHETHEQPIDDRTRRVDGEGGQGWTWWTQSGGGRLSQHIPHTSTVCSPNAQWLGRRSLADGLSLIYA